MSLQGSAGAWQALVAFLCYLAFPEVAVAQLLIRTRLMIVRRLWKHEPMPIRFFLASCLGLHARSSSSTKRSVPLVLLSSEQASCAPRKVDVLWVGRILLLVAFLVQYLGSVVIWIRLFFYVQDRGYWLWTVDLRTFEMVLGGLAATVNSSLILLVGNEWMIPDQVHARTTTEQTNSSETPPSGKELSLRTDTGLSGTTICCEGAVSTRSRFQAFNNAFSQFLDSLFPSLLQSDLELAVLLHRALTYGILAYAFRRRFSGGCPPILRLLAEASSTFDWTQICPDRTNIWDPTTVTQVPRQREHTHYGESLRITSILFNIAIARILGKWLFGILAEGCEFLGRPWARKLRLFRYWIFSGRSVVSFLFLPLLFSFGPVWVMCQFEQTRWTSHAQAVLQSRAVGDVDRMAMNVLMWKDPWHDALYLI
ncbi:hypothetical protein BU23DRAFT_211786 [Bimuria novae-zelandiae CBS 107.79]|uniref:Uncharacterized protein n=1 Tax=Bimuria novae-zelandiae CBS 107.79 TaxID=1447943 RepID=A0A6A5UZG2_9PLEO|nr:hypothetical protein BU23DRAFT_211786 [Bimuria novae-zelandiae CBS 107.79]